MEHKRRISDVLPPVAESVLALVAAMGLTIVLSFPLLTVQAEYPLPSDAGIADSALDELMGRIEERGIGISVEIVGPGDQRRLVVHGRPLAGMLWDEVPGILKDAGLETAGSARLELSVGDVVQRSARLALSIQALVFLAIGGLLIRFRLRHDVQASRPRPIGVLILGLLGGLAAFALSLVIGLVLNWIGLPVQEQEWARDLFRDRANLVRLVPWIVLIVPFSEEVFFRGYVLRFLTQRAGLPTGFVASTVLFALVHLNPSGVLIYLGIGAVLAGVYLRSRSILGPVVAHMVYNSLVLLATLIVPPP
jgi:membrane protease YdiL (CAAX protease family)